ncbi:DUF192 domain-containing protein [Sphingorhabdus sp. Alg239-R122]|uniref:DUF192 domain-containing protein n=1 Tax=Sphingorhabdus sp. Alg239-R122 TaxID=2305989 RepID=UPI0013DB3597|nr:DUF192 domain-containing protein [Sphingorhabdus sp. Alg239-R122]
MARVNWTRWIAICAAASLAACTAPGTAQGESAQGEAPDYTVNAQSGLEVVPLTITDGDKVHTFRVEVARTPAQQAKGMMFRTEMADDTGMIFPFQIPKMASFWMRNTVISLDLVFVRQDGTIESIAANAEPYSLEGIRSGEPVAMVLEIRGGLAKELGISAGDTVHWEDSRKAR